MQPAAARETRKKEPELPLRPGMRLKQAEFHRLYEQCPPHARFELIGGVVHMPSPLANPHGSSHLFLSGALCLYIGSTPGVSGADNATTILGEESEPQPDLCLRILAEYGGQSRINERRYIEGAPELIAEIADSQENVDLNAKKQDYQAAGVKEYLVVCLREGELRWFDFRKQGSGGEIKPRRGVHRSRVFPGLWIQGEALLEGKVTHLLEVVQQGIASEAHQAFVDKLARAHQRLARKQQQKKKDS